MQEQTYDYKDFKLEGILECKQTERTFKVVFHREPVALKAIDLYKKANLL
ncbi:5251_t:CDS:1, partial [Funneliformis mosseae]